MKICILGAGKMGAWFCDSLCLSHEVAIYDTDVEKLKYTFKTQRLTSLDEIRDFAPELLINATSLKHTISAFNEVMPYLPQDCIISDVSSVKTDFKDFYEKSGMQYVSSHPMFGPTFADLKQLREENAIIISEGCEEGKNFFRSFYASFGIQIHDYSFDEHDKTMAYSLSIPFASTLVFASIMKKQDAPGTTFKKHYDIAKGLLNEDDYLLTEILFNPFTTSQLEDIIEKLKEILALVKDGDSAKMIDFIDKIRDKLAVKS